VRGMAAPTGNDSPIHEQVVLVVEQAKRIVVDANRKPVGNCAILVTGLKTESAFTRRADAKALPPSKFTMLRPTPNGPLHSP